MRLFRFSAFFISLWLAVASNAHGQETTNCENETVGGNKRFVSTNLNLRSSPSRYGKVLVTLPIGELVYEYRLFDGWSQINVASLNVTGFVATRYLSETCIPGGGISRKSLSRDQIASILIADSLGSYRGNCPCPYNTDSAGRSCGRRSAYSRPGGRSPLCYRADVSPALIDRFRNSR